jgi:hypothetical protein
MLDSGDDGLQCAGISSYYPDPRLSSVAHDMVENKRLLVVFVLLEVTL